MELTLDELFPSSVEDRHKGIERHLENSGGEAQNWGGVTKGVMFLHFYQPSSCMSIINLHEYLSIAKLSDLLMISNSNYKDDVCEPLRSARLGDTEIICL